MKNKILVILLLACITITALCACGAVVAQTSTAYSADLYTDSDFLLNADGSLSDVTIRQFAKQVKSQEHLSVVYDLDKVIPPQCFAKNSRYFLRFALAKSETIF